MTVRALHRLLLKYLVLRCKFQAAAVTVAEAPVDSNYSEAVIWTVIQRQPEIHWPVNVAGAEATVTAWYGDSEAAVRPVQRIMIMWLIMDSKYELAYPF